MIQTEEVQPVFIDYGSAASLPFGSRYGLFYYSMA